MMLYCISFFNYTKSVKSYNIVFFFITVTSDILYPCNYITMVLATSLMVLYICSIDVLESGRGLIYSFSSEDNIYF